MRGAGGILNKIILKYKLYTKYYYLYKSVCLRTIHSKSSSCYCHKRIQDSRNYIKLKKHIILLLQTPLKKLYDFRCVAAVSSSVRQGKRLLQNKQMRRKKSI